MATVKKVLGTVPVPRDYEQGMVLHKDNLVTLDGVTYMVVAEQTTATPSADSPDFKLFAGFPSERLVNVEEKTAQNSASILGLANSVSDNAAAIEELQQAIGSGDDSGGSLSSRMSEAEAAIGRQELVSEAMASMAQDHASAIGELQQAVGTAEGAQDSLTDRIASVEGQLADGVGKIQGITLNGVEQEPNADGIVGIILEQTAADDTLDTNSTNPIQNKAVANTVSQLKAKAVADMEVDESGELPVLNLLNEQGGVIASAELPAMGGGGGGEATEYVRLVVSASVDETVIREGEAVELSYSYDSVYAGGDNAGQSAGAQARITVEVRRGGVAVASQTIANVGKGDYTMQIGDLLAAGANDIYVIATATDPLTGAARKKQAWTQVYVSALTLHSSFSLTDTVRNGGVTSQVTIPYTITGTGQKTVQCYVDGVLTQTQTQNMSGTRAGEFVVPLGAGYAAGRHTVQLVAHASVSGVELTSNSVLIDILKAGGSSPWVGVKMERRDGQIFTGSQTPTILAGQYETAELQFAAYDPAHQLAAVVVKQDGAVVQSYNAERKQQQFSTRFTSQGDHTLSIAAAGLSSGDAIRTLGISVSASTLDIAVAEQGLTHLLNAEGRSNAETDPASWGNAVEGGAAVATTFHGVDWSSSGWTGDSLKLMNGAKATVGIKPFAQDVASTGMTLEMIVRVDNVADMASTIISCIDSGKGFSMTPASVSYLTGQTQDYEDEDGNQATRAVGLSTKYDSGRWMRVALVISQRSSENLMELYIDGDRVAADLYGPTFNFRQTAPQGITFDSAGADIEIRRIRLYNRELSDDEVLDNTIVEQDSPAAMLKMWQDNNLLGEGAEMSMSKLRSQDKSVLLIVRPGFLNDIYQTNNKKTDFAADVHFYPGAAARATGAKEFHLYGVYIRIQGTSSTKYPSKNIRIYLQKGQEGFSVEIDGQERTGSDRRYALRSTTPAQKVLCAKKDYSDSSMSTNTGGAKLFHNTMKALGLLTPPQLWQQEHGAAVTVRTAIDGIPCDMFAAESMEGEPRYYGQYNLNNEKSSSEDVFGMGQMGGQTVWTCPLALESLNNMEAACLFAPAADASGMSAWLAAHFDDGMEVNFSRQGDDCKWAGLGSAEKAALVRLYSWIRQCKPLGADTSNISTWVSTKFKTEAGQYFDVDFLLTYYLIINYFMGVDQLAKNILWRTWDGEIWYPTFYDGDTAWGKRNDSFLVYDYNITRDSWDAQANKYAFEGHDSWLWCMVLANFQEELSECCDLLRQAMKNDTISDMLLGEQAGNWAERTFNKSGRIAYIDPAVKETYGRIWPYIYAGQGRNSPHRSYMIKNRCAIMDATYGCGDFRDDNIDLYLSQGSQGGLSSGGVSSVKITSTEPYAFGYGTNNKQYGTTGIVAAGVETTLQITGQFAISDPLRIYGASRIEKLDARGMCGTLKNGFNVGKCTAIRELDLSVPADGSVASSGWFLAGLDGCRQLRRLSLNGQANARSGSVTSDTLDLTAQNRLEYLDARGVTQSKHILFAPGSNVSEVYFPSGLQSLTLPHLPLLGMTGITMPSGGLSEVSELRIEGCALLKDCRQLAMQWINGKNTPDAQCTVALTEIGWQNCPVADALRLAQLVKAINTSDLATLTSDLARVTGTIALAAAPTAAQALELMEAFGDECFSSSGRLHITAPGSFIIAAPSEVTEGASAEDALVVRVVALQPMTGIQITATPSGTGISTAVDTDTMTVRVWSQEQGGSRSVTITAKGTPSDGMQKTVTATIDIVPYVYPESFTVEGSTRLLPGQTYTFELVPDSIDGVNGTWQTAWSVSGEGSDQVTLSQQTRDTVKVTVASSATISGATIVKATVQRAAGSDVPIAEPTAAPAYIMTSEMLMTRYSNAPLLAICKEKGWAEHADYMTFDEAAAVTSVNIENNSTIESLDELWWFTSVTSCNIKRNFALKSVRLPQNLTGNIGGWEYMKECTELEYLEIPAGVTKIVPWDSVFLGNDKLKTIACHAVSAPESGVESFSKLPKNGILYVPSGATGYDSGEGWPYLTATKGWTIKYTL